MPGMTGHGGDASMPGDPIQRLLDEHVELQRRFAPLRTVLQDLESGGDSALATALPTLREVSLVMSIDLIAHARREDDIFFPAVERVLGEGSGPTMAMREEHAEIHRGADRFRDTLRELQAVDHPAIVAGGERLRALLERDADAARLRDVCASLLEQIDRHFEKEEQVLFPMSRELLDPRALRDVARAMEADDVR
jgi:regulator of cell morphogenesis and NO signaling